MEFKHLLAKSTNNPEDPEEAATLVGHTKAVIKSFNILFGNSDKPTRLSLRWLNFFRLSDNDFHVFYINGLLSCLFHDIGKANNGFQEMARRRGKQLVRHEHLSGIFLQCREVQNLLTKIDSSNADIILSAVVCHHLKAAPRNHNFAEYLPGTDNQRFSVYPDELLSILRKVGQDLKEVRIDIPALSLPHKWNFYDEHGLGTELKKQAEDVLTKFYRKLKRDFRLHRLLISVRAGLIIADSSGSGLVREGKNIETWLKGAFQKDDLLTAQKIDNDIIQRRIQQIEESQSRPFVWQKWQEEAGNLPDRALLISACGSGKTLAAWRWIKAHFDKRPAARAIFLYPTKATASEGFRDYVSWAPEGILLHSSSRFELQDMFENPEERGDSSNFLVEDRLFALAYWHRRVFSATVHQFLGFMQYAYRSVCLLPMLADSVVVIDEVHSFDQALFSALKQFLDNFNVPVLCMTATLPLQRRQDLTDCGMTIFPDNAADFEDLQKKTSAPRYRVKYLKQDKEEAEILACESRNDKKVLWVVNTVDRCQHLAKKLNALCYHSRFKLEDRKKRHDKVIMAFKEKNSPLLAITTQVCEMSLDLDADVLISEVAPITSLIQRMGRCNRHMKRLTGEVYFYNPEENKPYNDDDLSGTEFFISALDGKYVSQNDLEELLERYGNNAREAERYTAFLCDRAWAQARDKALADIKETTVQAILNNDIPRYFSLRKEKKPVDGLLLPVPKYPPELTWREEKIGSLPLVASSNNYNDQYGFMRFSPEVII
jgi:CRISPR-associated endonuclease/helicase Cas3